ncbi:MAG: nodulation protein NfeD, partial [Gammaproteobacteria bacterium]|nr:nodulation protein NfeD [Gammaproteobacteria bacterium]
SNQLSSSADALVLLTIHDAIGPATADYFVRGIEHAEQNDARLVVLELDTPGGLDTSMRKMIKAILSSTVPVAIFVSPSGSRAASAGTYLLYASHIAAMAPGTNLGAATPVQIAAPGTPSPPKPGGMPTPDTEKDTANEAPPASGSAMERKAVNDAVAYIQSLAELRGRNSKWAERAVREGISLSAEAAFDRSVIDFVAVDLDDLLSKAHNKIVQINDHDLTLRTENLGIDRFEPDWRNRLLATITNPSVAYMLMLLGIYGLLFEGYNPGAILPGVVGAISLLLALYAFQVLSVNYAGLALIALGVVLMISEAFVPSFGALGLGGIVAFIFGSIILLGSDIPGMSISIPAIVGIAIIAALIVLAIVWFTIKMQNKKPHSGREELIGSIGVAREAFKDEGRVFVVSEYWNARS